MSAARLACAVLVCCAGAACAPQEERIAISGGDEGRGRAALERYGCGTCHVISAVEGARGHVGPPLDGVRRRAYLAGMLPNTPANMIAWIRHPQSIDRRTAMPDLGVSEGDARDMTAYFYSAR